MLAVWQATIIDENGNVKPGANIQVLHESTGALAALFSDRNGESPISNPITAGSDGLVRFYAPGGAYRIDATLGAFTRTWRHVAIGILGERDDVTGSLIRYDQTAAETNAGQSPSNPTYPSGPIIYPERFGVVGDGTANDSIAFQKVVDYVAQLPRGGMIWLDTSKSYRFEDTINWASKVFLLGNHAQIVVGSQDPVIDCNSCVGGGFYGVECEIKSDEAGYRSTTFFRVRGGSHKLRWDECFIEGFEHGWLLRGCWSMEIARCRGDKSINDISAYRESTEAIGVNDLTIYRCHLLSTYAVRTGDTSLPNAQVGGALGETIRIRDTQFDTGKMLFGDQDALTISIESCHGELASNTGRVISFEGTHYSCRVINCTIWGGYEGVYAGGSVSYLTVEGGDFRNMAIGVHAQTVTSAAIVDNARFAGVIQEVAGGIRSSNNAYAESLFSINAVGRYRINSGLIEQVANSYPTTGRYPIGSTIRIRHTRNYATVEPATLAGGAFAAATGTRTLDPISTTGNVATGSGHTITGVANITSLRKGDYVSISGAGSGGATHYAVIGDIDYANSTFDPSPNALTAVAGATITVMPAVLRKVEYAGAPPSSGDYRIGDIVYANAPAAAGSIGWVCTTAGNPGTWKTFGSIAA